MRLKNEALVGVVVLAGILVALVGAIWLSGQSFGEPQRQLRAVFSEVGVLAEGSPVKYRGVKVGRVSKIALAPRGNGVLVDMAVADDIVLPGDVGMVVSPESFFGDWQVAIVSRATVKNLDFVRMNGVDAYPGATMPDITQLTAVAADIAQDMQILSDRVQIAFTEETARDIARTVANVQDVSDQLRGFFDQQTRVYGQVSNNVLESTANIRRATGEASLAARDIRTTISEGEISQMLQNARTASANLAALSTQLNSAASGIPGLVARADTTMRSFGQTATTLNTTIQGLQPQLQGVGSAVQEAQQAMATLNRAMQRMSEGQGSIGRLLNDPALYEETQRAIATLQRLLADIQQNPAKYIGELQVF
ncbi:MAG TPA: MlaD family protein [Longimicrobium sp.]|nr:MlaD family protein [Longimicrobium sp.]